MQMNTLRMLPRARVNKQTNKQTKTPIGVREKIDRKDEDEEEHFGVTFVPVFGSRKNEVPLSLCTDEQNHFSTISETLFTDEQKTQPRRRRRKITKLATFRVKNLFVSNLVRNFAM